MNATLPTETTTLPKDALTKIKAGLADVESQDPFGIQAGEPLPASLEEIDGLLKTHVELHDATAKFLDNLETNIQQARADALSSVRASLSGLTTDNNGLGTVGPDKEEIAKITRAAELKVENEIRAKRVAVYGLHQTDIDGRLLRLAKAEARLADFVKIYPTPLAYLEAAGLESEKRSTYHRNIAHAGPGALKTLARLAIKTGNRSLGAAVAARLNEIPEDLRPFTASQLAKALVGAEYATYAASYATLKQLHQNASNAVRQFQSGRTPNRTSLEKISAGVAAGQHERPDAPLGTRVRKEASRRQA